HRLTLDPHHEIALRGRGHGDVVLDALLGEERATGGDLAEDRQTPDVGSLGGGRIGLVTLAADQLERARLRRIALQQTGPLEVREMRVNGRRGGEPDLLADLAHSRGIAVQVDVLDEVVPDLLLTGREHWGSLGFVDGDERVFAIRVETPADAVNVPKRKSRPTWDGFRCAGEDLNLH